VRITDVRTTAVAEPQHRTYRSSWRRSGHGTGALQAVLVELVTDDGPTGIGEAPVVWAGSAAATIALIEAVAPLVVGADPLDHDLVRRRLYAETGMAHLGTQGISWALSGIDTALWDLAGRIIGLPLHRLWGGAWRTRSGFHADLVPDAPEAMAEDARGRVAEGFRTLYLKVGFAPEQDEARVRAVREAVGDGPRLRIDANGAWSPGLAKRLLDRLAAYDLEYAEQPIPPGDPAELARLRARVAVPILAHESSLSVEGTLAVVRHGAADAVQLDPRFDAGIAGAHVAAQIADVAGLPALTHTFGELGVGTALMLQFHAAHRNLVLDSQTYYPNLTDDVIADGPLRFDGCFLEVPTGPGLGVELDPDRVAHYAAYHAREVAGRPAPPPPDDPYYDREYLIRPRV
jgi:glucarate dehydratase